MLLNILLYRTGLTSAPCPEQRITWLKMSMCWQWETRVKVFLKTGARRLHFFGITSWFRVLMSLFFLTSYSVPSKPWRHSVPETIAPLLFLGFFQAADTSSANCDAYAPALTTVQDRRLAGSSVRCSEACGNVEQCAPGTVFGPYSPWTIWTVPLWDWKWLLCVLPYLPPTAEALFQHLWLALPHSFRSHSEIT